MLAAPGGTQSNFFDADAAQLPFAHLSRAERKQAE